NVLALETLESLFALTPETDIPENLIPQMSFLADYFLRNNNHAKAIRLIKTLLRSSTNTSQKFIFSSKLAVAYAQDGNAALSEKTINNLLVHGINVRDLFQLSYFFYEQGFWKKAIILLHQCVSLDPHYAEPYLLTGVIWADRKEYVKSLSYLHKGLDIDPSDNRFKIYIKNINLQAGH
ncbi:MAG: tetratricopeptide repeat protein, partial [Candidatus Omnitrophota bacterium]